MNETKPRILILGGCGFIGRNLVAYCISEDIVSFIRIVDKVPPQVAWLNVEYQQYFQSPLIEFKSANLINLESCKNAFSTIIPWDYVINCAGETKFGQTDPIYNEGILKLSLNCAKESSKLNVKHYIELSSGCMYSSSDKITHNKEDDPVEPWTFVAKWKRHVEKQLKDIPNLNYTILRLPIVYGIGDRNGLTPIILIAAIYKEMNETMKLLWNADLKMNTIHVRDVCRSIWFVCTNKETLSHTYNVVDENNTTLGSITKILSDLFKIKISFYGNIVSSIVDLNKAADDANDKHLEPWARACKRDQIFNTPLTPHMDRELLLNKHLSLDGSRLKNLGLSLDIPQLTEEVIQEIINDYVQMNVFPTSLAP